MENPEGASDVEANQKNMQPTDVSSATHLNPNLAQASPCAQSELPLDRQCDTSTTNELVRELTIEDAQPQRTQCESPNTGDKENTEQLNSAAVNRRRATTFADPTGDFAGRALASSMNREENVATNCARKSALKGHGHHSQWESGVSEQTQDTRSDTSDDNGEKPKRRASKIEKDSLRAWLTIASTCFVAYGMLYGTTYTFPVLYTALEHRFSTGPNADTSTELLSFRVSWIGSACFGMSNFLCVFSGMLTELVSTQLLLLVGAFAGATGILASAFVDQLEMWYITYVCITGLGNACIYLAVVTALSEHFERHFSLANGVTSLGSGVMQTVFPFIWQHLLDSYGLPAMLYFMASCYASLALFVPLWRSPGDRRWFAVRRFTIDSEPNNSETEVTNAMTRSRSAEDLIVRPHRPSGYFAVSIARTSIDAQCAPVRPTFCHANSVTDPRAAPHKVSEGESNDSGPTVRVMAPRTLHASLMQLPNAAARRMRAAMLRNAELSPLTKPLSLSLITSLSSSTNSDDSGKAKCDWCKLTLFRNKRYVIFLLGMMLYEVGTAAPDMFIVSYTDAKFDTTGTSSLVPLVSYSITMCVAKIGFSKLLSSFSKNLAVSMLVFQLGPCLNGITMSLIPIFVGRMNSYPLMIFTCVLWGLSDGPPDALLAPVIRLLVGPELTARAVGYCVAICMTSSMLGPPLAGLILDTLHTYDITFCISSTLIFLGTCTFFFVNLVKDDPASSSGTPDCEKSEPAATEQSQPLISHEDQNGTVHDTDREVPPVLSVVSACEEARMHDFPLTNAAKCESPGVQSAPDAPFSDTLPPTAVLTNNSSSSSAYSTVTVPSVVADTVC